MVSKLCYKSVTEQWQALGSILKTKYNEPQAFILKKRYTFNIKKIKARMQMLEEEQHAKQADALLQQPTKLKYTGRGKQRMPFLESVKGIHFYKSGTNQPLPNNIHAKLIQPNLALPDVNTGKLILQQFGIRSLDNQRNMKLE